MEGPLGDRHLVFTTISVTATVTLAPGEGISHIVLSVFADIPALAPADFAVLAEEVKGACPVSRALTGTTIELEEVTLA